MKDKKMRKKSTCLIYNFTIYNPRPQPLNLTNKNTKTSFIIINDYAIDNKGFVY
ncbi:hypothetical protein [Helicobacter apodemus]|uniref:hypothetical protein n=1 Tax=Helicobacter apodemus TaxID=135569 RepID=UPI0013A57CF5|nr:hypothetical protein [Helicobacter apodemus]